MVIKVVHIVAGLWKDTGGPAEVIPNLCRAQAAIGLQVTLCSIDGENAPQLEALQGSGVDVRLFKSDNKLIRYSHGMKNFLYSLSDVDIIHNHGHWLWPNWFAARAARFLSAKLVTTPHGTLVQGMLSRSRLKKAFAWIFFDRNLLYKSNVIHALSPEERDAMVPKLKELSTKVIVIPNGVSVPQVFGQNTSKEEGIVLFLSRVTTIKGVIPLLSAWHNVAPSFPGWRLQIVGPIDEELRHEILNTYSKYERVEFLGPVYHDDRWEFFRQASCFVLPSFAEGLPTVLLEAAAYGLPVVTTRESNFRDLYRAGGSILTRPDQESIELSLTAFLGLSGKERSDIGIKGRRLVEQNYEWEKVATKWLATYKNTIGSKGS